MDNLNYRFFEEFKHLDKLCGEIYKTQYGITHYIDDMRSKQFKNYRGIPDWDSDLRQLIRLRHIRNKMAHEENAFNNEDCTRNDIDWVREFYKRIMNRTDPLAMLYKKSKTIKQIPAQQSRCQTVARPKKYSGLVILLIVLIAIVLVVLIIGMLGLFI